MKIQHQNHTDEIDSLVANTLRFLAVDAVQAANSGHPGLPLGAADLATVLWTRFLHVNPADPRWLNRDRFVLSAGHGSALLYALLHLAGYPLSLDEVKNFRQWGSKTPGHPEYDPDLGIETTTGPLGQGLATAVGMALAERITAARLNRPNFEVIDHYTYVLASDGDLMEGISHEAASLAGHLGLSKLVVLYDDNHISIDGSTDLTLSDDALARFAAYGWHTQRVDGHDIGAVEAALWAAQQEGERPSLIACRTHIGYGSPMQDSSKVHGSPLGEEGVSKTKEAFGWPAEAHFLVPEEVRQRMAELAKAGAQRQRDWEDLVGRYLAKFPDMGEMWELLVSGELPDAWESTLPEFGPDSKPLATRSASGKVLNAIAPRMPWLIGGSADLTPSNNTRPADEREIVPGDFSGRYLHFGVREHAMGAILNGLALHGLRPYGGTFLIFSDYMRPAIRLAALMKLPVVYVFTHDSIGLGEDGPTHQPVEQLSALRAIPNLDVIRPADGNETVAAWKQALLRTDGPTALALTRQATPPLTPSPAPVERGAYVVLDAAEPDVVLIGTGSELQLAVEARDLLAADQIRARVVSMPCWERLDAQPTAYRESVLPAGVPRVAVEAGVTAPWGHVVGLNGAVVGLDHFGASAPYQTIFSEFGITAEAVAAKAKEVLAS